MRYKENDIWNDTSQEEKAVRLSLWGNFCHCSISGLVAPSSMQKLWTPPTATFDEKKVEKKIGKVLDPFELPDERNFWHLEKNGVLKFFEQVWNPEPVIHLDDNAKI